MAPTYPLDAFFTDHRYAATVLRDEHRGVLDAALRVLAMRRAKHGEGRAPLGADPRVVVLCCGSSVGGMRTLAWLNRYRPPTIRYERRADLAPPSLRHPA